MPDTANMARRMWQMLEPVHAALYYAPQASAEALALGHDVESRWPSYFAWRAAPLGCAGPTLVASTFYSFDPQMVADHVPAVWTVASPGAVLDARGRAVRRTLGALLGDQVRSPEMVEAANLARTAATAAVTAGRPLAAANADLAWPREPHEALWHAATVLREHRGDGHITALQAAGLDPCESLVSLAATGTTPAEVFTSRGWTTAAWDAARRTLVDRGWIDRDGTATETGRRGRAEVEDHTDLLAAAPWHELGPERTRQLAQLVAPWTTAIAAAGILPRHSTLGMTRPSDVDAGPA